MGIQEMLMSATAESHRICRLETRLDRIEQMLNLLPIDGERVEPARLAAVDAAAAVLSQSQPVRVEPVEPPPLPNPATAHRISAVDKTVAEVPVLRESALPDSMPLSVLPYAPASAPPVQHGDLEQTIGLKWAGWIGALVLAIGAGLGIKYAYQQGYFEILPPAARLFLMSMGGFALIAAGEWVFRRVNKVAAAGLYASGVATLFFVSHAGHAYYGLYEPTTAFAMMALTTLIGAGVAMRGRLVSIAVLSLIGGNLAPFVLDGQDVQLAPFLTYLLMLQLVSVTLAYWGRDGRWRLMRGLSLASTALWMLPMVLESSPSPLVTAFAVVYALIYQLELLASAARGVGARDASLKARDDVGFSIAVTAALTGAVLVLNRDLGGAVQGAWIGSLSAVCGLAGMLLADKRRQYCRPLAVGFIVQSAALAVLAVPVAFSGPTVSTGWAMLALAFAGAGAVLDHRSLRSVAAVTWGLAAGHFAMWAMTHPAAEAAATMRLFSASMLAAAGHAIAWLTVARCDTANPQATERMVLARLVAALAGVLFVIAAVAWLTPLAATAAILAYAWVAALMDRFEERLGLLWHAVALVLVAAAKWAVVDTLADRLAPGWSAAAYRPLLNPLAAAGVLTSLSIAGLYWLRRDAWPRLMGRGGMLALAGVLVVLMAFTLSVEVDRIVERALAAGPLAWPSSQLKQLAWTMLWTLAALVYAGFARVLEPDPSCRARPLRVAAVAVLLLGMKFLLMDTFGYRLGASPADVTPLANLQVLAAAFVVGALVAMHALLGQGSLIARYAAVLAGIVALWTGSLEIDRAFDGMLKQLGLSIFWSVFAVTSVAAGFRIRAAGLRYAGLALFALALLKVVVVDLRGVADGYRVLSFMGLGALLLGTSVLYGKLSPKLLEQ
jgi:uncharacterized membrane protein